MKLSIATVTLASMASSTSAFVPSIPSSSLGKSSITAAEKKTKSALNGVILNKADEWIKSGIEKFSMKKATKFVDESDIQESSKETLKQLDVFAIVASALPSKLFETDSPPDHSYSEFLKTEDFNLGWKKIGDEFSAWEKDPTEVTTQKISDNLSTKMQREDDEFGQAGKLFDLATTFVRKAKSLPLEDKVVFFNSKEEAIACTDDLHLSPGMACPPTYNTWGDMSTDESLSRYFFNGFGVVNLMTQKETSKSGLGPFEADMPIHNFEVRPGFRPYGARVHFDADQKPTGIFDYAKGVLVKPGDDDWESAKWLAKTTAFTLNTAKEHLMWGHLAVSNSVTLSCNSNLPPNHPIRRLLQIFTYRTNTINDQAFATLVPEFSTLHRATSFTYPALQKVFEEAWKTSNCFEPFCNKKLIPELQALSDEGKFPYFTEGNAYFASVRTFVQKWIDAAGTSWNDDATQAFYAELQSMNRGQAYEIPDFSEEAFVDTISQAIFYVTAMHEIVGTIIDYASVPNGAGTRIVEGAVEADAQAFLDNLVIVSVTGLKMPKLMTKFENYFAQGGAPEWEKDVWNSFVVEMEKQSKIVKAADEDREVEFKFFDPARFECSISV
mmetsp:Transcript_7542/g.9778  ORF Transcript_7542/g.9778 Transcript_7542/m.9778 type:complete len:611 (+) Transcript_7542:121-1953(+)|eukprot:CAMPEP_0195252916 /NCGR_PEP_ID=MMETSP0706-20130129/4156_1 /TAXON_ID=33640 /ORGANISM="Asterionellopsis glacialis, Strain CCMP134" /LENGTH=610 /DNA_ID=CAMNT_0040305321 /DNA_START=168 /DNA_END=2000 /DNA_ORIENTATION=-